jgi:hypothetical protein
MSHGKKERDETQAKGRENIVSEIIAESFTNCGKEIDSQCWKILDPK